MDTPSKIEDSIEAVKNDDSSTPLLANVTTTTTAAEENSSEIIDKNQTTATIYANNVAAAEDDDDDDDDDEYYYSKRLKIVEEDADEKCSINNEQSLSSTSSIKKSPAKQQNEEEEIVSDKIELSKTPSPLPPLTYTANEQQINDNQSINSSESPPTEITDNDQSACLKVPPLKIICSKGDFSLVTDENQKSNDSETTTTTVSLDPSTTTVDTEEKSLTTSNENESISKNKETTVIIRKTTVNDNNVTYEVPTTRSTRNQQLTNQRSLRDTLITSPISNTVKTTPTTRNTLLASPVSENMKTSSHTMIRRKLRSHTRQQGSGAPLSPSNTTSNSSADFVEVNLDDSEENKKETESSLTIETQQSVEEIVGTSRKRKVRQQMQTSENSNDGNTHGKELNSTISNTSSSSMSSTNSQLINSIQQPGASNILNNPVIQQLPLQRVFLNTNNCIKQFIEIRTEIVKRRELLKKNTTVEPKLPKNYDEFCLVKKNYLIKGNKEAFLSIPFCPIPSQITEEMKELYTKQEKDRYNLQIRQRVEQDKMLIMYEHEVIRSFNQTCKDGKSSQLSFCTIIKDDEIYSLNHLTSQTASSNSAAEQQQQDEDESSTTKEVISNLKQNLNDLEQKFQKLKDDLIKRQLHESDSLHAVQLMDWQSKLKKVNNNKINLNLHSDPVYVPIVIVNSKFELTPIRTS